MKKKIIFICSILFVLLAGFNADAKIFKEDVSDYISAAPLKEEVRFNVMRGISESEFTNGDFYWDIEDFLWGYYENGYVDMVADIVGENFLCKGISARYEIANTDNISIVISLGEDVFYQAEYNHSDSSYKVLVNNEVDLNKAIGYSPSGFEMLRFELTNNGEGTDPDYDELVDVGFGAIYTMLYKYEESYSNSKVHFISNILNPLTEEQILNSVSFNDSTDGTDVSYQILYSEYDYNNPAVGEYPITICATDKSGNTTLLNAYVNVVAVNEPKITTKDISVTYRGFYREQDIKPYFKVECDYDYTLEIIENNYKDNYIKPGDYTVTAKATDIYGNSSTATLTVHVVDDLSPRIAYSLIQITTLKPYTIEDFKKHITVYDEIDGIINDYTITDLDGYFDNVKKPGDYRIRVDASDKAGNKIYNNVYFTVRDTDYPTISVGEYTIVAEPDHVITREEIIDILAKLGQITDDNVSLTSDYFDVENPTGSYVLEVRTGDNIFYDTIEVQSTDYVPSVVKNDKKKFNNLYVIIPSVICLLGILSFVVYKKKH